MAAPKDAYKLPFPTQVGFNREVIFAQVPEVQIYPQNIVPDLEYWGSNPPGGLGFTTSSPRKGRNGERLLNKKPLAKDPRTGSVIDDPIAYQDYLLNYVPNGDKAFKGIIHIGFHYGVPVYLISTEGEGETAHASDEAKNKVRYVAQRWPYDERNVILMSIDTINGPVVSEPDESGLVREVFKPYGKPIKYKNGRRRFGLTSEDLKRFSRQEDPVFGYVLHQCAVRYIEDVYQNVSGFYHRNALVALDLLTGETHTNELDLRIPVSGDIKSKAHKFDPEVAAGAMLQAIMDMSPEGIEELLNTQPAEQQHWYQLMRQELAAWPEEVPMNLPLMVVTQLQGMPLYAALELFRQAAHSRTRAK